MSDQQVRMLEMKLHDKCCENEELRRQLEMCNCEYHDLQRKCEDMMKDMKRYCEDMECRYQCEIDRLHQEIMKLHAQYRK